MIPASRRGRPGQVALPGSSAQRSGWTPRSEDSRREAGAPLRPDPSRPVLRACACPRVRVPGRGMRRLPYPRGLGDSPRRPPALSPSRRLQTALEGAPSPSARPAPPPRLLPAAAQAGSPRRPRAPAPGPLPPGRRRWRARQAAPAHPRPAPPRNSTQVGSRARAAALAPRAQRRRRGGDGGGGGAWASEAAPARPSAVCGGRPHREQQEEGLETDARRRPARESKVGAGGCAWGPGGAAARTPVRRPLAGRMGGGAPGPPPPAACASAGRRGRGAAEARPTGCRVAVASRPGRSP